MILDLVVLAVIVRAGKTLLESETTADDKRRAAQGLPPVGEVPLTEAEKRANYHRNMEKIGHPKNCRL